MDDRRSQRRTEPVRTCVGCRRRHGPEGLIRLVRGPDGDVLVDHPPRLGGRGAWVCASQGCVAAAARRGVLSRAFGATATVPSAEAMLGSIRSRVEARVDGLLAASGRARKVAVGAAEAEAAVRRRGACLVLLARDVSPRVRRSIELVAEAAGVVVASYGDRDRLGASMARSEVGALALADPGFCSALGLELDLLRGLDAPGNGMRTKAAPTGDGGALERST